MTSGENSEKAICKEEKKMAKSRELTAQIAELNAKRAEARKAEQYDEMATDLRNLYASYVAVGFTEEQAWKLTEIVVTNATKK